ncbi:homoserine O-acetyltransferase MetX [Methylorubrum extorquens]|uniref:homoserine O-acetyltransferase MetX n=1 Tax=Methylorubrum extorquens TaxID=408 RepID=UPI001EE5947E|nr:homoserine O-acetyltransferase [Methylorubrum extorquens]MCG5246104.1 homoserine O-acetyltransferase [Methylorubrum extorquens]
MDSTLTQNAERGVESVQRDDARRAVYEASPASDPRSPVMLFSADEPLAMDSGARLGPFQIAYQTAGTLNAARSNAVLICHALTGDQHFAQPHPVTGKPGWWETLVGPGKPVDTNRYFVVCSNVIGSCMGSTGPASLNPETGRPYGLDFPLVTIRDMVRAQAMLLDRLGIPDLFLCIGGSMGGMQVLQWASLFPERVFAAMPIATGARHSAQNIAFHEVGRQAIMADPAWEEGRYLEAGTRPSKGLGVARMGAHITYLSEPALHRKFGRRLQNRAAPTFSFNADFQIESYLRHQGLSFVERFDANAYLYLTRAMDYFDLAEDHGGVLGNAFRGSKTRFCVMSFTSDWLFPTADSRAIVHALNAVAAPVAFVEVESDKGHDAFLLDEPAMFSAAKGFIDAAARARGL